MPSQRWFPIVLSISAKSSKENSFCRHLQGKERLFFPKAQLRKWFSQYSPSFLGFFYRNVLFKQLVSLYFNFRWLRRVMKENVSIVYGMPLGFCTSKYHALKASNSKAQAKAKDWFIASVVFVGRRSKHVNKY